MVATSASAWAVRISCCSQWTNARAHQAEGADPSRPQPHRNRIGRTEPLLIARALLGTAATRWATRRDVRHQKSASPVR